MPAAPSIRRLGRGGWLAAILGAFTGCSTTHLVMIDAINNPAKPMGTSYRLEVNDPGGGVDQEVGVLATALSKDALAARGLHEAPAGTKPDMIIELEYGRGPGQTSLVYRGPSHTSKANIWPREPDAKLVIVFEKYLQLTARESPATAESATPPPRGSLPDRGEELWSVRVAVEDQEKQLAPYLPALASVCVDYIGRNSGKEVHVEVDARKAAGALPHPQPVPSPR
jgi:hypothetical protein